MSRAMYFFSFIIGIQLAFLFYEVSAILNYDLTRNLLLLISASIVVVFMLVFYLFEQLRLKLILIKLINKNPSVKAIESCESKIAKCADNVFKSKLAITLAKVYIKNNNYEKALKVIKKANPKHKKNSFNWFYPLPQKYKLEYYLKSIYLNTIFNNLIVASDELVLAKNTFKKYTNNPKYKSEILKTIGMLEYNKGNYNESESILNIALKSLNNKDDMDEIKFILSKIYLKTQKYEIYEKEIMQIIKSAKSDELVNAAREHYNKNKRVNNI